MSLRAAAFEHVLTQSADWVKPNITIARTHLELIIWRPPKVKGPPSTPPCSGAGQGPRAVRANAATCRRPGEGSKRDPPWPPPWSPRLVASHPGTAPTQPCGPAHRAGLLCRTAKLVPLSLSPSLTLSFLSPFLLSSFSFSLFSFLPSPLSLLSSHSPLAPFFSPLSSPLHSLPLTSLPLLSFLSPLSPLFFSLLSPLSSLPLSPLLPTTLMCGRKLPPTVAEVSPVLLVSCDPVEYC